MLSMWEGYRRSVEHFLVNLLCQEMSMSLCRTGFISGFIVLFSVIDVGTEWRTFGDEKGDVDPSRVGGPENHLLNGADLSTMIGPGPSRSSDFNPKYINRKTVGFPNCA